MKVELKKNEKRHKCHLIVSDNGIGVTDTKLKLLNKKLNNEKLPEHGLGLRVVKQIVKKNRWKIVFENVNGAAKDSNRRGFLCRIEI